MFRLDTLNGVHTELAGTVIGPALFCYYHMLGGINPSFVITHRLKLEDGPAAYRTFRDKQDGCIKVVLKPKG